MEEIRVGEKSKGEYISAILYGFQENHDTIMVSGLGSRVSKAYNVTEQVTQLLSDVTTSNSESFEIDGKTGVRITLERRIKK